MANRITIKLALIGALTLLCFSIRGASAQEFRSERFILKNGLTVLISEIPTSPMVCVYGLVKTGSAREGKFVGSGISHFLEHMLFKGTHGREVGEIATSIQAVGGSINASTGYDFTIYTINVPYDHVELAMDVLKDMLFEATIDGEEAEKEREVIFAEMRMHDDNPDRKLNELTFLNAYQKHPYRHPVIGYEGLLKALTREDLYTYYQQHYAPNNMILSVAGRVDPTALRTMIESRFSMIPMQPMVMDIVPSEPIQLYQREYEVEYPTDITRLSMVYKGVRLLDEDLYALDVLAQVLGQGESSRLYQLLYKKEQLVYSIYAGNYTPEDLGLFTITAQLQQEHLNKVKERVLTTIEEIKKRGISKEELQKAKRQVLSDYVKGTQKASSVAWHQATDEAFAGDYRFSAKYVQNVRGVTSTDIKRVAHQYLCPSKMVTTVLKPQGSSPQDANVAVRYSQGEIKKHQLHNGLTVLIREDHTFPLVAVRLSLKGGVLSEPTKLNGIAQLTSEAWVKGTKSLTSDQIEEKTESLGIDLSAFSGKNSFGLSMNLLSEDLDVAFSLLEDILINPSFPMDVIERRKKDMINAIKLRDEDISAYSMHTLRQHLYQTHPYRLDQLGSLESLEVIDREKIQRYYQDHASARNMVLSVFGDVKEADVLKRIEKFAAKLPAHEVNIPMPEPEELSEATTIGQSLDKEQAMVMIGFRGIDLFSPDRYVLEITEALLGSSFSGRLFNSVREELGKGYTMGGASVPGFKTGFIVFYVLTEEASVDTVLKIMNKEITKLSQELVSPKELEDIKTYLKGSHKAELELNDALAFTSGLDELYGLGFKDHERYDEYIDKVTQEDIRRVAGALLQLERSVTVVTQPGVK